ncbi:MAG: winged helix-turn-helix domain-containing protein [Phycisphaerae bacterium]
MVDEYEIHRCQARARRIASAMSGSLAWAILCRLHAGPATAAELREDLGRPAAPVRTALERLQRAHLVEAEPGKRRNRRWRLRRDAFGPLIDVLEVWGNCARRAREMGLQGEPAGPGAVPWAVPEAGVRPDGRR